MNTAQGNVSDCRLVAPITVNRHVAQCEVKGLCS